MIGSAERTGRSSLIPWRGADRSASSRYSSDLLGRSGGGGRLPLSLFARLDCIDSEGAVMPAYCDLRSTFGLEELGLRCSGEPVLPPVGAGVMVLKDLSLRSLRRGADSSSASTGEGDRAPAGAW